MLWFGCGQRVGASKERGSGDSVETDGQTGKDEGNKPAEQPPAHVRGVMHSWLRDLVISVVVSAIIIIFLYQPEIGRAHV